MITLITEYDNETMANYKYERSSPQNLSLTISSNFATLSQIENLHCLHWNKT